MVRKQKYGEAYWRTRRKNYNHNDIRRDTIRGNSFVISVKQKYLFLFLKKHFFWDDMLCCWVNICLIFIYLLTIRKNTIYKLM
jgi:hypothetical protein